MPVPPAPRLPLAALVLVAGLVTAGRPAGAQSVIVVAQAIQRVPDATAPFGYRDQTITGCIDGRGGALGTASATFSCALRDGLGTGASSATYGGPLRVSGGLAGLQQQPPGFNQLTSASAFAGWTDQLLVNAPSTAGLTLTVRATIDGGSVINDRSVAGRSYTQGFLWLTTPGIAGSVLPWGAPSTWGRWALFDSDRAVRTSEGAAFAGRHDITTSGITTTVTTDGLVTFGNIPLVGSSTLFTLGLQFGAVLWNAADVPADVPDDATFDYGRTVRFAGFTVTDAGGADVTAAVGARLLSGAALPGTTVPEPATAALLGGGLAALALARGRARRSAPTAAAGSAA